MSARDTAQIGWREVYLDVLRDIESGVLGPGAELPTIAGLARASGLTQHGARKVLARLRADGVAQSWQGKGYRVALSEIFLNLNDKSPTFHGQMAAQGRVASSRLLSAKTVGLPQQISQRLRRRPGSKVTVSELLRAVDARPVALSVDFFVPDRLRGICKTIGETCSVSMALRAHGVSTYQRDRTSIRVRLPTAHEALLLAIPKSQAVYVTLGTNLDAAGEAIQVSKGIWRADCVRYEY